MGQLTAAFEVKSRVLKSYLLSHFLILLATNWIMRNLITWEKHIYKNNHEYKITTSFKIELKLYYLKNMFNTLKGASKTPITLNDFQQIIKSKDG